MSSDHPSTDVFSLDQAEIIAIKVLEKLGLGTRECHTCGITFHPPPFLECKDVTLCADCSRESLCVGFGHQDTPSPSLLDVASTGKPRTRTVQDEVNDFAKTPEAAKDLITRLTEKLMDLRCPSCGRSIGIEIGDHSITERLPG